MKKEERATQIMKLLKKEFPSVRPSLYNWKNAAQFLVAVILSAQCTDERVNIVTKELFKKYKTAADFSKAKQKTLEKEIHSTGFYKNKAKNIIAANKLIVKNHKGKVPKTMEELLSLPGVARKTANVVLGGCYGINQGIAVDTHVKRVSFRLGLTQHTNPEKIEQDLMQVFPQKEWENMSLRIIFHGRKTCQARKPNCTGCVLNKLCPSAFKEKGFI